MFDYRHATLASDLERHRSAPRTPLTVVVAGASGLIGRALCAFLSTGGHRVLRLVRRAAAGADEIRLGSGARHHRRRAPRGRRRGRATCAGANVGDGRWTRGAQARAARQPRRADGAAGRRRWRRAPTRPARLLERVGGRLVRHAPRRRRRAAPARGDDFLAELCGEWEAAAEPARDGRHSRRASALRHRAVARRRRAAEDAAAVQARSRRHPRRRRRAAVVGRARRRARRACTSHSSVATSTAPSTSRRRHRRRRASSPVRSAARSIARRRCACRRRRCACSSVRWPSRCSARRGCCPPGSSLPASASTSRPCRMRSTTCSGYTPLVKRQALTLLIDRDGRLQQ